MTAKTLAWHWLPDNSCLRYPPHTEVEVGQTLTAEGPLELCENGMHASLRALDALQYAPSAIVCRVELSGEIVEGDDKLCARHRKVLAMADATKTLHEFACWCAEQALLREREAGREPNPRSWAAIEVKRRWLKGEATDEELYVARAAARNAAWDAARVAARVAAWAAARATQNAKLEEMLNALLKEGEEK